MVRIEKGFDCYLFSLSFFWGRRVPHAAYPLFALSKRRPVGGSNENECALQHRRANNEVCRRQWTYRIVGKMGKRVVPEGDSLNLPESRMIDQATTLIFRIPCIILCILSSGNIDAVNLAVTTSDAVPRCLRRLGHLRSFR
jgi:hypothetical protein